MENVDVWLSVYKSELRSARYRVHELERTIASLEAARQSGVEVKALCDCDEHASINDDTPGICGTCGKPFRH